MHDTRQHDHTVSTFVLSASLEYWKGRNFVFRQTWQKIVLSWVDWVGFNCSKCIINTWAQWLWIYYYYKWLWTCGSYISLSVKLKRMWHLFSSSSEVERRENTNNWNDWKLSQKIHIFAIQRESLLSCANWRVSISITKLKGLKGLKGKILPLTFPVDQQVGERQHRQEDESVKPARVFLRATHEHRLKKRH